MKQNQLPQPSNACAPAYSATEEFANALTHGLGFIISVIALNYMITSAPIEYSVQQRAGILIYGITLALMFFISTSYHALKQPVIKGILKRFDHASIYLLIAGTYTPMLTISIKTAAATSLLTIIWSVAAAGIIFKAFFAGRFQWFSISSYLAMGWISLFVIDDLFRVWATPGFTLLILGGVAYSIGVVFYVNKAIAYNHAIWHCFVLIGALSHCWLILEYVIK